MDGSSDFRVRAFRAVDEPGTSERYHRGHIERLASRGVPVVHSAKPDWLEQHDVFAIVAERGNRLLGGVKLHRTGSVPLPVEQSVGAHDERLLDLVERTASAGGSGEACGLWCGTGANGWNVSRLLMQAVVALAAPLGVRTLFGLSPTHTLPLFEAVGYRVVSHLGNEGDFVYPTDAYVSRVIQMDAQTLADALPDRREAILELRQRPVQTRIEHVESGHVTVDYSLAPPEGP